MGERPIIASKRAKIGFIGLGKMGSAMALNLLRAQYEVLVFARNQQQASPVLDAGAQWAASPAIVAASSNVAFTILGGPHDVEEIYFGANGLLENSRPNSLLIDMTTSSPELAKRISDSCSSANLLTLDAPVTGGVAGATSGKLTFMVGGASATIKQVRPILEIMGDKIFHMGDAGAGQTAKSCNQIAVAGILLGAIEAIKHGQENSLSPDKIYAVLNSGTAHSTLIQSLKKRLSEVGHSASFSISHFIKDLKIAIDTAASEGRAISTAEYCMRYCQALEQSGNGEKGLQALLDIDEHTPYGPRGSSIER